MSRVQYDILSRLRIFHDFYTDGFLHQKKIIPDAQTQIFMWNSGLLARQMRTGITLYHSDQFTFDFLKERIGFFRDQYLSFRLFDQQSDFAYFTDCPINGLIEYQFSNRKKEGKILDGDQVVKMEPDHAIAEIRIYLSEFLGADAIKPENYEIRFKTRSTSWWYYVMNLDEEEARSARIKDPEGFEFHGPIKSTLPDGSTAFEFNSGDRQYPFRERPDQFCRLEKSGQVSDKTWVKELPAPMPSAITKVSNENDRQVVNSSVYIYL